MAGGALTAVELPPARTGLAVASLIDVQVNGCAGDDFITSDAEGWPAAAAELAGQGTTSFVASLITSSDEDRVRALGVAQQIVDAPRGGRSRLLGVHLKGPFLAPDRPGVHPRAHLTLPDPAAVDRWTRSGPVVAMTLAPELIGAISLIEDLAARGVLAPRPQHRHVSRGPHWLRRGSSGCDAQLQCHEHSPGAGRRARGCGSRQERCHGDDDL